MGKVNPKRDNEKTIAARKARNKEVLSLVRDICAKNGGSAEIGGGFVVVNTKRFEVKEKS